MFGSAKLKFEPLLVVQTGGATPPQKGLTRILPLCTEKPLMNFPKNPERGSTMTVVVVESITKEVGKEEYYNTNDKRPYGSMNSVFRPVVHQPHPLRLLST